VTTEYCKTWAPVGGVTEVRPQNAAKHGILREGVPTRYQGCTEAGPQNGCETWDTCAATDLVRRKLILWKSVPRRYREGTTQNAAKRGILWEAVPRWGHRMLQNVGSCGRLCRERTKAGPQNGCEPWDTWAAADLVRRKLIL